MKKVSLLGLLLLSLAACKQNTKEPEKTEEVAKELEVEVAAAEEMVEKEAVKDSERVVE